MPTYTRLVIYLPVLIVVFCVRSLSAKCSSFFATGGCVETTSINISAECPPPQLSGVSTPNTSCIQSNGGINLSVNPAGPYSFLWSNGETTEDVTNLASGSYTVTVTTALGCTAVTVFSVKNFANPIPSATGAAATCNMDNGYINLSVSGHYPPFIYLWSNGETTEDINHLAPGDYTVTVTGANGCTALASATVTNYTGSLWTLSASMNAQTSCLAPNGAVNITVMPHPPNAYTFLWSNGATTADISNVPAGTYTVTITNTVGCTTATTFNIPSNVVPPNLTAQTTAANCGQANGAVTLGVTPAAGATFQWSNGATSQNLTGLLPGTYTATVTGANGCTATTAVTVGASNVGPTLQAVPAANTSCNSPNGSLALIVSPTGAYTFLWSNGAITEDIANLGAGVYTVTVSGGGSCTSSASYTVPNNTVPPNVTTQTTAANCGQANGTISLSVTPVTGASFQWSNGATSQNLTGLLPGTYTATVTGANGCTAATSATVQNNTTAPWTLSAVPLANTSCAVPNGMLNLSVSPAGAYTFLWSNAATTEDLTNLGPGLYSVTISGAGSCTSSASYTVPNNTVPPNVTTQTTAANCGQANGTISLSVTPVTGASFQWSNGATSQNLTGLLPGTYTATVTGANGCTAATSATVQNNTTAPWTLSAVPLANTSCAVPNGMLNLSVSPAGAYTFLWSNAATTEDLTNLGPGLYSVTISGAGGCTSSASYTVPNNTVPPTLTAQTTTAATCGQANGAVTISVTPAAGAIFQWSNGATSQNLTSLLPGTYTATVTGANGCTATRAATVVANNASPALQAAAVVNTSCTTPNGSLALTVSPADAYTFLWSNGAITEDLSGIAAGAYSVTVTGPGSCTTTATYAVANNSAAPVAVPQTTATICAQANGAINLTVSPVNGTSFLWSNGATTQNLTGLTAGTYAVTVTGADGCQTNLTVLVDNTDPVITANGSVQPNTTCTSGNGAVALSVDPAGAYTFLWSNGATIEDLANLTPGVYTVTVSGGGACTSTALFNVPDNSTAPILTPTALAASCEQADGGVTLDLSSGAGLTFLWSNGTTTQDLTQVAPGSYTVTVTAPNGCSRSIAVTVPNTNVTFSLAASPTANTSCNMPNGALNLDVLPAGGYTYLWSNGASTEDITGLPGGDYVVTVSAGGTCTATAIYTIPSMSGAPLISPTAIAATCGQSNGAVDLTVSPADGATFLWSNGATTQQQANLVAGLYTITATAANGCANTATIEVPAHDYAPALTGAVLPNTSCASATGSIDLTVVPAGSHSFLWSNGATTEDLVNLAVGAYTVTVSIGTCTATAAFMVDDIVISPMLTAEATSSLCGQVNGAIDLVVTPGGVYTFLWSNGATTEDLAGLEVGNYAVTVTTTNGCTATIALNVDNTGGAFSVVNAITAQTACIAANGTIDLTVTPAGAYTFLWSNGATTEDLASLEVGYYAVTIDDGNGCPAVATYTIAAEIPNIALSATTSDILCFGATDGQIALNTTGGNAPYAYVWSTGATATALQNLPAGTYAVTATDVAGCTASAIFTLNQSASAVALTCAATAPESAPGLADGAGSITAGGGTAPYILMWTGGSGIPMPNGALPLNNLPAGAYLVTVTDANNCPTTCAFTVASQSANCITSVGTMETNATTACGETCISVNYDNAGEILQPTDAVQFVLHQGSGTTITGELARSAQPTFCFLPGTMTYGTTYYISVVAGEADGGSVVLANPCTAVAAGAPVVFNAAPVPAVVATPLTCLSAQSSLIGTVSIPGTSWQWTTVSGTLTGATNQSVATATTAGTYTLITEANGCADTALVEVIDLRNQLAATLQSLTDTVLDCASTELSITAQYTGTEDGGLFWMHEGAVVAQGAALNVNMPGLYQFVVLDSLSFCSDTAELNITANFDAPVLSLPAAPVLNCRDTVALLTGSAGAPTITLAWAIIVGLDTLVVGQGAEWSATAPGAYLLIGIDPANGCRTVLAQTVFADTAPPLADAGNDRTIDCHGTPVELTGSASAPGVAYLWSTATPGIILADPASATQTVNVPGIYTLVVERTDNYCRDTVSVEVFDYENSPGPVLSITPPTCRGDGNGYLVVTAEPAQGPYEFLLDGQSNGSNSVFTALEGGDYVLEVIDNQGCRWEAEVMVTEPMALTVDLGADLAVQSDETAVVAAALSVPLTALEALVWGPFEALSCTDMLCPEQEIAVTAPTEVWLTAIDTNGCRVTDRVLLSVQVAPAVYIPNVFSPDSDGGNNTFTIYANAEVDQVISLQVYERWGAQVFHRENFQPNDPLQGWNGRHREKPLNPDVFVYWTKIRFKDGTERIFEGDITLVR